MTFDLCLLKPPAAGSPDRKCSLFETLHFVGLECNFLAPQFKDLSQSLLPRCCFLACEQGRELSVGPLTTVRRVLFR